MASKLSTDTSNQHKTYLDALHQGISQDLKTTSSGSSEQQTLEHDFGVMENNFEEMIHFPRNRKDWCLFIFFWIGGLWTVVYENCIVVWYYHNEWNNVVIYHIALVLALAVLIVSNMCFLITTDVSVKCVTKTLDTKLPDWKYCENCSSYAPPRSHHCKICDMCILKRDHHCWFVGYCIGFGNHRYLISLAFYACIAGIYCNIYNWDFVMDHKGGLTWTTIPSLFAPHIGLVFGSYSVLEFAVTANTSLGLFFAIFFVWLFYSQTVQIINGQVMFERKKGIYCYNFGLRQNIKEVFGSAGLFALMCPYLPSKLVGDGTYFLQHENKGDKKL